MVAFQCLRKQEEYLVSLFTILVIILGMLAGLINFAFGVARREHFGIAAMRFLVGIVSFGVAAATLVVQIEKLSLPKEITDLNLIYLFIALGLFIGATLMLPATIERSVLPASEQPTIRTTGKLSDNAGVRIANQGEDWVN
jgi:hypothetical protein